jgi:hypothetical protein
MARIERLLDQAYYLIEDGHIYDAARVLDAVIEDDPHDSRANLELLADRVRRNRDLTSAEKREILSYQEYILNHLQSGQEQYFEEGSISESSKSALTILTAILVALLGLWSFVPEVRSMVAFYFLVAFIIGLGFWFWKSDQSNAWSGSRSFSYGVSTPQLRETEKPELFFYEPIIKIGPMPDEEE